MQIRLQDKPLMQITLQDKPFGCDYCNAKFAWPDPCKFCVKCYHRYCEDCREEHLTSCDIFS